MTSTRTKELARKMQRANPTMKYTEALRHAEAGRVIVDEAWTISPESEAEANAAVAAVLRAALRPEDEHHRLP